MSAGTSRLQFILSLIDRVSGPLTRIQARLHAMGLEQMKLFSQNFHSYGNAAAATARKVALITAALTAAIAATGALVSAMAPMMAMAGASLGAALGTANTAGVAQESALIQQQTGMDTGKIQQYRQAGRSVGMEAGFGQVGDVGKVFAEVNAKLAAPDDALAKVMQQVKIPMAEIKGLKPDELLNRVVTQAEKLGMTDVQTSAILEELAGDASKLLPLLGKNEAALQRFQTQSAKVGAIITPEQAELMKITNTEWALMKTGAEGYGNIMATVGGNFMKLFGPEINDWFASNADGMRQWADDSVKELQRLHGVFKTGGLQAVYEDLFPNLSAFTGRVGAFVTGFNASFSTPFMATVREVWADVAGVLGDTAGGAQGLGAAIGGAILPVFSEMMEVIGSTVLWLEWNWDIVKQMFSWSPLGLIMDNWGAISDALQPVMDAFTDIATSMGMVAPGMNEVGSSGGTLMGILTALAGIVFLNKIAFGAAYHVVKLYRGVMILLKATTMAVTAATWLYRAAMAAVRIGMLATLAVSWGLSVALPLLAGGFSLAGAGAWLMAGAMAVLTSPITLIIIALAALAAGAIYLYNHWAEVKAYLADTVAFQILQGAFSVFMGVLSAVWSVVSAVAGVLRDVFIIAVAAVIVVVESLIGVGQWLYGLWESAKSSFADTAWGQSLIGIFNMIPGPVEMFNSVVNTAKAVWDGIKASLSNTSWGQAIIGTIESILGYVTKFTEAWGKLKSAASEKISGAWGSVKATLGVGADAPANGGARALGGTVLPGHFYKVNERGPELMQTMGQTFLMTGGAAGNIIPFPTLSQNMGMSANMDSFTSPDKGTTGGVSLPEARPVNVRDLFASANLRNGGNTQNTRNFQQGRTVHIGTVVIQPQGNIDAEALLHELEMVAGGSR